MLAMQALYHLSHFTSPISPSFHLTIAAQFLCFTLRFPANTLLGKKKYWEWGCSSVVELDVQFPTSNKSNK
jgi:hypothetical protein